MAINNNKCVICLEPVAMDLCEFHREERASSDHKRLAKIRDMVFLYLKGDCEESAGTVLLMIRDVMAEEMR